MPLFTKFFSYAQPKMSKQKLLCLTCKTLCLYFEFLVIRGTYRRLSVVFVKFLRVG